MNNRENKVEDFDYGVSGAKTVPRIRASKNTVCKNSSFLRILPPKSIENMRKYGIQIT